MERHFTEQEKMRRRARVNLEEERKIQTMPLVDILRKYGLRKILQEEIRRRAQVNLEEVRDFYKNHNPFAYIGDCRKELNELSNFLKVSPIELLNWDCFIEINDIVAREYLSSDFSWLKYENIPKKINNKSFLCEVLLKDGNIYKHPDLINLLSNYDIEKILLSNQIDLSEIPNIINIINDSNIGFLDLEYIIIKYCTQKKYNFFSQLLSLNKIAPHEKKEIILKMQNKVSSEEFLNILNALPTNIIQYINKDEYFFKKMMQPYINDGEIIKKIINSSFASKINVGFIRNTISYLTLEIYYDILIDNDIYYSNDLLIIDSFNDYFNQNFEKCLSRLTTSRLIQDFLKSNNSYNYVEIPDDIAEKCYQYIFNDLESLKFCINNNINFGRNIRIDDYLFKGQPRPLNLTQQENIVEIFDCLTLNDVLDGNKLLEMFDKYSYIKEKIVGSKKFEQFLKRDGSGYIFYIPKIIFPVLDRYPEVIDIINFDLITVLNPPIIMKCLDEYPRVEELLMNNNKFISYVLSDEKRIFKFMPLINKYQISNEIVKKYNENFKKIQEIRPELSWGNSSLRTEMLSEDFINIIGVDYIDAVLSFDSEASNIVVNMYHQSKLGELKKWLDYASKNISKNHRMIHYYIMSYGKMESLINELVKTNAELNDYEKQILEEIIDNENLYDIKSLNELDKYFEIKASKILAGKKEITRDEVCEIFFNTSSLHNGVPWKLKFSFDHIDLDYIKYKYVRTGILTEEEFKYLQKIKNVLEQAGNYRDTEMIQNIVMEYIGSNVPTGRSIINKIRAASVQEFNSKLLDIDELRKIASYDDPSAQVYIEIKDGIEYIHLNGYDYKCIASFISREKRDSTFSHNFKDSFEQYTVLSEKIKKEKGYQNLGRFTTARLISENPENWNLIEGISTISSGLSSSRHSFSGFGWGRKSNIDVIGISGGDASLSQKVRDLKPNETTCPLTTRTLYGTQRGEFWFDRTDASNERIQPEFIMYCGAWDWETFEIENVARYFGIPIVVRHREFYDSDYMTRLDTAARKKFLETFDIDVIEDILFNHKNKDDNEKINFIINNLRRAYETGVIDYETYISKLTDLKWKLHETGFREYKKIIDTIFSELSRKAHEDFKESKRAFELGRKQERRLMNDEEIQEERLSSHIR